MTDSRHKDLAAFIGCEATDVEAAFGNLFGFAMWAAERSETGEAKRDAAKLRRMAAELDEYSNADFSDMRDELLMRAKAAEQFTVPRAYPATKGRKEQARVIADAVARVFVAKGLHIGYGKKPDSPEPSGPFGRAVQFALTLYAIDAHWFGPAKEAAYRARNTN